MAATLLIMLSAKKTGNSHRGIYRSDSSGWVLLRAGYPCEPAPSEGCLVYILRELGFWLDSSGLDTGVDLGDNTVDGKSARVGRTSR
jgi:hypothetical protein